MKLWISLLALLDAFGLLWIPIVAPSAGLIVLGVLHSTFGFIGLWWVWQRSVTALWKGRLGVLESIDALAAAVIFAALPWYAMWLFDSATQLGGLGLPVTGNFAYAMMRVLMGTMFSATGGGFGLAFIPISGIAFAWGFFVRLGGVVVISVAIGSAVQWFIMSRKARSKDQRPYIVSSNTSGISKHHTTIEPLSIPRVTAPFSLRRK